MLMLPKRLDGVVLISDRAIARRDRAIDERKLGERRLDAASVHAADDSPWYAFRIHSGRELSVENSMRHAGIECIVPMRKGRELRRRGRTVLPIIPVMVGYIIARFEPSHDAFSGVSNMEYVIGAIGGSLAPHPISHWEVREFDQRAREGYFDWSRRCTSFKRGTRVKVIHGPFKGEKGSVVTARQDGLGDAVVTFENEEKFPPALLPLAVLEKL